MFGPQSRKKVMRKDGSHSPDIISKLSYLCRTLVIVTNNITIKCSISSRFIYLITSGSDGEGPTKDSWSSTGCL